MLQWRVRCWGWRAGGFWPQRNSFRYISEPPEPRESHETYQIPKPDSTCQTLPIEQRANCVVVRIGSGFGQANEAIGHEMKAGDGRWWMHFKVY